ncbi:hypothetical protein Aperf_G00000038443 [Anoplocephala perfoliata]
MGKRNRSEEEARDHVKSSSKHKHNHKHKQDKERKKNDKLTAKDLEVHSANAWEDVKFESDAKKDKFLRLMGAQKQRKHPGSIQIGETTVAHARAGVGVEELGKNLEKQFSEGLEHRASWKRHAGLGCSGERPSSLDPNRSDKEDKQESHSSGKYMNFVKSSDK